MNDNALYLEVDEDITSAIDKLSKSQGTSVQIVVPKRSTMLQSIINLKLLKKAADSSGRELVLVTGDRIATELAARVGLAVAPSIGAKPVISEAKIPESLSTQEEIIEADDTEPVPEEPKPKISKKPLLKRMPISDGPPPESALAAPVDEASLPSTPTEGATKASITPKIPSFKHMQKRLLWVVGGIFLIIGYMACMYLFTSAKVTLYASGTKVDIDTSFAVDPSLKTTDQANSVLAGQVVTTSKDLTGPFTPTGTQDAGTKSAGTITISNCFDNNPHTFVAGTRFQAPDGNIFRSTSDAVVPGGQGSFFGCTTPGTVSVAVQADQNGDKYNEAPANYTMPGLPASEQTDAKNSFTAKGAQMTGGSTKTITIVAQSDVDTEKATLLAADKDKSARDLQAKAPSGFTELSSSQTTNTTDSPSPAVGGAGSTGSLTIHVTYTILAVKQSEYSNLIHAQEQKQVGSSNQIYDDGLSGSQVSSNGADSSGRQSFHLTTVAYGGPKIDKSALATNLKGLRYGDAATLASGLPGVARADLSIWPGWISNMPSRTDKITINIQVAGNK